MEFTPKQLADFKRIFKQDYGEELDDAEARRLAGKVITLFKIIAQPIPKK